MHMDAEEHCVPRISHGPGCCQVHLLHFHNIPSISPPGTEYDGINSIYRKHCTGLETEMTDGPGPCPAVAPPASPQRGGPRMLYIDTINSNMTLSFPSLTVATRPMTPPEEIVNEC